MRPIGFVICCSNWASDFTKDKIYPYFMIGRVSEEDTEIYIQNDLDNFVPKWMFLEHKSSNNHLFDFYCYPEFPEDINQWTEEDWVHYHLKYGE